MIALRGVSKSYRAWGRETRAVEDVTLDVAPGEVLGIAGPNGAGKSTLIALLLGFLRPSAGHITVDGLAPRAYVEQRGISYVPELITLPKHWRVRAAIRRLAILSDIPASDVDAEVTRVIERLEIDEHAGKRMRALSKGNAQRVGLAQALVRVFNVAIFDEPTHGLDPVWTQRFRTLVSDLRHETRVVVIASHNLDELERICDRVAILDRGRLQRVVDLRGGRPAGATAYVIRVAGDAAPVITAFPGAVHGGPGEVIVPPVDVPALNAALQAALAAGAQVTGLAPRETDLEAEFRAAVGNGVPS